MIRDCLVATLKRVWPADLRSGTGFSAGAGGGGGDGLSPKETHDGNLGSA